MHKLHFCDKILVIIKNKYYICNSKNTMLIILIFNMFSRIIELHESVALLFFFCLSYL